MARTPGASAAATSSATWTPGPSTRPVTVYDSGPAAVSTVTGAPARSPSALSTTTSPGRPGRLAGREAQPTQLGAGPAVPLVGVLPAGCRRPRAGRRRAAARRRCGPAPPPPRPADRPACPTSSAAAPADQGRVGTNSSGGRARLGALHHDRRPRQPVRHLRTPGGEQQRGRRDQRDPDGDGHERAGRPPDAQHDDSATVSRSAIRAATTAAVIGAGQLVDDAAVGEQQDPVGVRGGGGSWVTITTVCPCSSTSARSSRSTCRDVRAVQRPGRLVGEDHRRTGDQRSGHGDALLLAAGQLARPVPGPVGEPDGVERGGDVPGRRAAAGQARAATRRSARRSAWTRG